MPAAATAALIAGAAMAAGGTAAAVKAQQARTQPRGVYYGGSTDALRETRGQYAGGVNEGAGVRRVGMGGLGNLQDDAAATSAYGTGLITDALGRHRVASSAPLVSLNQGRVAADRAATIGAQDVIDQTTARNIAMSRGAGALGMRQAMAENAGVGSEVAREVARIKAENEANYARDYAAQLNLGEQQLLQQRQQDLAEAGLGAGLVSQGYGTRLGANSGITNAGLITEGRYLEGQRDVDQAQLAAELDYERRRQADQQRKSQNLWNLGGSLITGGARTMAGGFGGGGG